VQIAPLHEPVPSAAGKPFPLPANARMLTATCSEWRWHQDPRGMRENVAWKDFCEDIMAAQDTTNGKARKLAAARGAILDPSCFE
jgi:hypothetical protein